MRLVRNFNFDVTESNTEKNGEGLYDTRLVPTINHWAWNPPHFLGDKLVRTMSIYWTDIKTKR
ncbi:hypothetical protein DP117_21475 [Brasilonema sp. UFV-L1]|nr:hypothetical protein [Brasilonema sp. UFV-L1]